MNFARYVLRRLGLAVFVILGVLLITFIISHSIGGNPIVAWLGNAARAHPELANAYAAAYHLNDPIWVQFYYYVLNLAQGNLGYSPSRGFVPVTTVIEQTLPFTLQLAFFGVIFSLVLGVLFGVLSARYHHSFIDRAVKIWYLTAYSSPSFFVALVVLVLFSFVFRFLPGGGAVGQGIPPPTKVTGIPMLDSLLTGDSSYLFSSLQHIILPSLALALTQFGVVVRILRTSMLDVMRTNFIRTVRAKGLGENAIFFRHVLRNSLVPLVSISALLVTWIVTGTVFVEYIFAYPGLGQFLVSALASQDYPGILASTLIYAIIIVLTNLTADLLYVAVDPQIRLS